MEVTITTENFESYKNGELPLVVDLWATWCGPCRQIAPIVSELAEVDDEDGDILEKYNVRNMPLTIIYKGGLITDRIVGAVSEIELRRKIS